MLLSEEEDCGGDDDSLESGKGVAKYPEAGDFHKDNDSVVYNIRDKAAKIRKKAK